MPKNWMLTLALAAILPVAGCTRLSGQGQKLLESGYDACEKGDHKAVLESMDKFVAEHGKTDRADEGYYLRGLACYQTGQKTKAREDFAKALELTRKKELRGKACLALADIAWDVDDMKTAEEHYHLALKDLPADQPPADRACYRRGVALQRLGQWSEADVQFHRVMDLFKASSWAKEAARRLYAKSWTIQVGAFKYKTSADAAARRLAQRGCPAEVRTAPEASHGLVFLVQAGAYSTHEEAVQAIGRVRQIQRDAFITPK